MIWIYRWLFLPCMLLALPAYLLRMWRRGGYRQDFMHRFGAMGAVPARRETVRRIWVQAVSVGELLAVGPLLEALASDPSVEVCLTTTTSTGRKVAEEKYAGMTLWRGIFPLDWWLFSAQAWRRLQPDLVVLMESEIWPEHLQQAAQRGVPVLLLNARLSDRSFKRYRALRTIARPLMQPVCAIFAGTDQDAERFQSLELGAVPVTTSGNMKFDVALRPVLDAAEKAALRAEIGARPDELVLVGASTWPGEEAMIASTAATLRAEGMAVRALIVPRHAERRQEVVEALGETWGRVHLRTHGRQASEDTALYVADTTGELARFIQIADLVFVGKTMPPHTEGQTPIEAAGHGKPILLGPGTSNFRQIAASLVAIGAARRVATPAAFEAEAKALLGDEIIRATMGTSGAEWFRQHQGATEKAIAAIYRHLPSDDAPPPD